jgi:hypothetical protein
MAGTEEQLSRSAEYVHNRYREIKGNQGVREERLDSPAARYHEAMTLLTLKTMDRGPLYWAEPAFAVALDGLPKAIGEALAAQRVTGETARQTVAHGMLRDLYMVGVDAAHPDEKRLREMCLDGLNKQTGIRVGLAAAPRDPQPMRK